MILNAENQILGRLLSFAAKKALNGEQVIIVNAEKAVISGKKEKIFNENLAKLEIKNKGNYTKGPFHYKRPDYYVKKAVRGMLPYNKPRGVEAYTRIRVYIGMPERELRENHNLDLKKEKPYDLKPKRQPTDYVTVEEVCRFIGGKW
ncbi:MAG: 50S ribosomal protein L13 [Candidatus Altiarchaeales archaeon]|nr:50S ribosomal protein L13 [Candidatus Altiarchaeales archaeon]